MPLDDSPQALYISWAELQGEANSPSWHNLVCLRIHSELLQAAGYQKGVPLVSASKGAFDAPYAFNHHLYLPEASELREKLRQGGLLRLAEECTKEIWDFYHRDRAYDYIALHFTQAGVISGKVRS